MNQSVSAARAQQPPSPDPQQPPVEQPASPSPQEVPAPQSPTEIPQPDPSPLPGNPTPPHALAAARPR